MMHRYLIFSILLLSSSCGNDIYTVMDKDGLFVREKPDLHAKHVLDSKKHKKVVLGKGTKVKVLFWDDKIHKAHGAEAPYAYVEYKEGQRGYVFAAFLRSESSSRFKLIAILTILILAFAAILFLAYRYRAKMREFTQKFGKKISDTYEAARTQYKETQDLKKIQREILAEKNRKTESELQKEKEFKEKAIAEKTLRTQVRGIKLLLFIILLVIMALNNPTKDDLAVII